MSFLARLFLIFLILTLLPLDAAWMLLGSPARSFLAPAAFAVVLSAAAALWLDSRMKAFLEGVQRGLEQLARGVYDPSIEGSGAGIMRDFFRRYGETVALVWDKIHSMEERFLQEKTRVESLVNNIPDGIVIADLRGDVLYINESAMSILGVKRNGPPGPGKGLFDMISQQELREPVQNILKQRTQAEVVEIPISSPQGSRLRYFHTNVTLFSTSGKDDFGVLLIMRDVTMERELAQMKEEFFHSAAHDLRAPVFAAQGYVRLLEKQVQPDAKTRVYFTSIYQACEKLLLFIQDILDTYRLDSGQMKLALAPVEPQALVQRLKSVYGPAAEERGISLEVRLPQESPGSVEADERLLERIFNNLISNAMKVTPRGGSIVISMAKAGPDRVEFSVSDTGPGIAKERQARLFEKFHQLENGQERTGYGLGLYICRKIVELHTGVIRLESEPGRGSRFVFEIPRAQPAFSSSPG